MSLQRAVVTLFSVILTCLNSLQAARIAMMPLFGSHHFKVFSRLEIELQQRGHRVVLFVGDESDHAGDSQMTQIFSTHNASKINSFLQGTLYTKGSLQIYQMMQLFSLQHEYCDAFFNDKQVLQQLSTANLVVGDAMYACSALAAAMFNIPHVVLECSLSTPSHAQKLLARFPELTGGFLDNAGFYLEHFTIVRLGLGNMESGYENVKHKYGIKPDEEIWETLDKVDLVLVERDRPYYSDMSALSHRVRVVGNLMSEAKDSISPDLESFASTSGSDGIVLVYCDALMSLKTMGTLHAALARLPQKVVWKIQGEFDGHLASNVKLVECIPDSIIAHSKVKLLLTDGTTSATSDAVSQGVPLIFLSSHDRILPACTQSLLKFGAGELVEFNKATVEDIVSLINKVIQEKSYKENVLHLSRIIHTAHPHTPLQEAAAIIESFVSGNRSCINESKRLDTDYHSFKVVNTFLEIGIILCVALPIMKKMIESCGWQSQKSEIS